MKNTVKYLNRLDQNIITFIIYGLLYDIVINLYKPFAVKFLDRIGGTEFHISLFNSLPGFVAIFALLPGSLLIGRFKRKKKITSIFFTFSRTFLLMLVFVPFMPSSLQPVLFVVLVSSMNFFDAVSQCSLQSFLGETFNGFTRARAISLRNKFGNMFILLVTSATGLIITFVPKTDAQRIIIYQIFFALSFTFGLIEIFVFNRFKEKSKEPEIIDENAEPQPEPPNWNTVTGAIKDKQFKRFLITTIILYFAWQAGWPLSSIFQIKTLGANELWLAAFAVSAGVASFFTASLWAKLISKKGNDFALIVSGAGMVLNMFFFALTPNLVVMVLVNILGGSATIGLNTTLLNGLLGSTPDKNRVVYIGVYNTFVNVSLAISPYVSWLLLDLFSIRPALALVGVMRLLAVVLLLFQFRAIKKKNATAN